MSCRVAGVHAARLAPAAARHAASRARHEHRRRRRAGAHGGGRAERRAVPGRRLGRVGAAHGRREAAAAATVATAKAIADQYKGLINGFVLDKTDAQSIRDLTIPAIATQSVMVTLEDRVALARECIRFLGTLQSK